MKALPILPGTLSRKVTVNPFVWEAIPIHPAIAAKPESGRVIHELYFYNGAVMVGYGDWTGNTGVVKVLGHYANSGQPFTLLDDVPSEAIERFREFDGVLYVPWIDPTNSNQGGYSTNEGGVWQNVNILGNMSMVHTFDIIKFKGLLFVCGSWSADGVVGHAVVYRRGADGVWSMALKAPTFAPMNRFYTFTVDGDTLTTREYHDGTQTRLWSSTSGLDWMPGPWELIADTNFKADPKDPRGDEWFPAPPRLHPASTDLFTAEPKNYPGIVTDTHIWTVNPVVPGQIVRTPV